jgi:hypothetical protein
VVPAATAAATAAVAAAAAAPAAAAVAAAVAAASAGAAATAAATQQQQQQWRQRLPTHSSLPSPERVFPFFLFTLNAFLIVHTRNACTFVRAFLLLLLLFIFFLTGRNARTHVVCFGSFSFFEMHVRVRVIWLTLPS